MILEAMYNGEFYPCETVVPTSPEYRKAVIACEKLMEQLSQRLSKEDYELVQELRAQTAIAQCTDLVTNLVAAIPQAITNGLTVAGNLLSALGFAMLLSSMLSKKMFPYFLLGFLIVAYSGLSLIGVTMFAAILAFILDKVLYGKGANA